MRESSDSELLRNYLHQHSEEAFAELVRRRLNLVFSAALRHTGNTAQAEEITQAVFIILARKGASLPVDTILSAWLYKTARLTALHFLRGERRRQQREQEAIMQSNLPDSPHDTLWRQLSPLLDDGMARLNNEDRQALLLRFFEDKSLREVAAALGINEAAAQRRVRRAVEKLRSFFARRGITVATAALTATMTARSIECAPAGLAKTVASAALGAAAPASTLTLVNGALKTMAWTKAQTTVAALVIAGLTMYSCFQYQTQRGLRQEDESLRKELASLKSANEEMAARENARAARWLAQTQRNSRTGTLPNNLRPLYNRLQSEPSKLTPAQLAWYLKANARNASSLLAAYRTTGDKSLLQEAMAKFPNDPHVAFEAAMDNDLSAEARRQWLDTFEKSAPDNSLANYLSALSYFNSGQTNQALQELSTAAGRQFDDYTMGRVEDDTEAYLAAGYSLADAKALATQQLLLPQLAQIKQLGGDVLQLAQSYNQAGDQASASAALQTVTDLGQRYETPSPGEAEISQLVGIAVEQMALRDVDPASAYGDGGGTVQDRLNQLAQERAEITATGEQAEALAPQMTDDDWVVYKDRWLMFGEANAQEWLINKYGGQ